MISTQRTVVLTIILKSLSFFEKKSACYTECTRLQRQTRIELLLLKHQSEFLEPYKLLYHGRYGRCAYAIRFQFGHRAIYSSQNLQPYKRQDKLSIPFELPTLLSVHSVDSTLKYCLVSDLYVQLQYHAETPGLSPYLAYRL